MVSLFSNRHMAPANGVIRAGSGIVHECSMVVT